MRIFGRSSEPDHSAGDARCEDLERIGADPASDPPPRTGDGTVCEDCVTIGENHWAHLRKCLVCGHVGCCDSSPRQHASAHFHDGGHAVMRSAEPGERWRWCYIHEVMG